MSTTAPRTDWQHQADLLGDADPAVRLRAALDLGEGRHTDAAAALVARFGVERDFAIRETLTWATLRIKDVSLPLVRDALRSDRWLARLQATHALSKVGEYDDGPRLLTVVDDPVDVVASRAYWAVAQSGNPVAVPALVGELSRGSSEHRNSLLVALSHFGATAVPALVGALRHGATPQVRQHAADTLGYLGSPDADPASAALADAVADSDEWVRIAALNALGQLHVPAAWELIDATTQAPEPRVRTLASRLAERRPSERALRIAAAKRDRAPVIEDAPPPAPPGDIGRWPAPDLDLVTLEGGPKAAELAPKLALQVEICRPSYLSRADVPPEELAAVHDATYAEAITAGRPAALAERIAAGQVEQHIHETVFLEQVSVADPGMVVRDLLFGTEVRITGFARLDTPLVAGRHHG